jgi:hypothetical protein
MKEAIQDATLGGRRWKTKSFLFPKNPGAYHKNLHEKRHGEMKLCGVKLMKNIIMPIPGDAKSKPSSGR